MSKPTTVEEVISQTISHRDDVVAAINNVCSKMIVKSFQHDHSKETFPMLLLQSFSDASYAAEWKEVHVHNEDHHMQWKQKGNETLSDAIEMLADWVCASARRGSILDPEMTHMPKIDWELCARNTLRQIQQSWDEILKVSGTVTKYRIDSGKNDRHELD